MFSWLHPDIGVGLAQAWSNRSRTNPEDEKFEGEENERLMVYCRSVHADIQAQYYVFGHQTFTLEFKNR
jgi:UDP-2,3-diacylglucosamine hydrolase